MVRGCRHSQGLSLYVLAPAAYVGHIPDGLDAIEAAPIRCAGVTTYKGLEESEALVGEWVVIVGVLGHLAVQYATAHQDAHWRPSV